jgi:hypothetical protein
MSLLTELVSIKDGFSYKHGAPNGAVTHASIVFHWKQQRAQDPVWKDSRVEFFAQPMPERGYFNFEFNCGGAFLCYHITNPERTTEGFKGFVKVDGFKVDGFNFHRPNCFGTVRFA